MKFYKQLSNYDLEYINKDNIEIGKIISDEEKLISYLDENILVGFKKEKSFIEVSKHKNSNKYYIRYSFKNEDKELDEVDFKKLSFILKCYKENQIGNITEFKVYKKEEKKYGKFFLYFVSIPGAGLFLGFFILARFNGDYYILKNIIMQSSFLLVSLGFIFCAIFDKEIYVNSTLTAKLEEKPVIYFLTLGFWILFTILGLAALNKIN
jgi:hypothetical protein